MSREEIEKLAKMFGATIVGELPDFGGGAFAAAQHTEFYRRRMQQVRTEHLQSTPTGPAESVLQIPVSSNTVHALAEIAALVSTEQAKVSPAEVAAGLLESAATIKIEEIRKGLEGKRRTG